jgi:phage replication initiation protein
VDETRSGDFPVSGGVAVIDWLSWTFAYSDAWSPVPMVKRWLSSWCHGAPIADELGNGLFSFEHSVRLYSAAGCEAVLVGVVAWGGEHQRGRAYVSLTGTGCGMVREWKLLENTLRALESRITRCDVAVDALNGEFTVPDACDWYRQGLFTAGGNRPKHKLVGDTLDEEAPIGRTLYVGKRENGKLCRVYEKGKQLGNRHSAWTRAEVELHNVDRVIPYDILTRPGEYFAGLYPCCEGLVDVGAERIRTLREESEISLNRLVACLRSGYGRLVHVLRMRTADHKAVLDGIDVEGVPRRLEKAALLLHTHGHQMGPPIGASPHE